LTLAIAAMALGFGALYPQFETENAAQIPTSFGGLVYMMATIALLAGVIVALWQAVYVYVRAVYEGRPVVVDAWMLFWFTVAAAGMEVGEPAPEVEQTERRRRAVLQVGVEAVGRSGHPEIQLGGGHERPATPDRQVELPAEKRVIRVEVIADAETDGGSRRTDERLPAPGASLRVGGRRHGRQRDERHQHPQYDGSHTAIPRPK